MFDVYFVPTGRRTAGAEVLRTAQWTVKGPDRSAQRDGQVNGVSHTTKSVGGQPRQQTTSSKVSPIGLLINLQIWGSEQTAAYADSIVITLITVNLITNLSKNRRRLSVLPPSLSSNVNLWKMSRWLIVCCCSLMDCYAAQFEPLPRDTRGVPLEHLVTCVAGLELVESGGKKYICPSVTSPQDNGKLTYYNTLIRWQHFNIAVFCFKHCRVLSCKNEQVFHGSDSVNASSRTIVCLRAISEPHK